MKIFNIKISSAHQHQIQGWNRFRNLRGYKHKSYHPHRLQDNRLQYPPAWIHIQIHGLKKIAKYNKTPQILKAIKPKAAPRKVQHQLCQSELGQISTPKQHRTLLPTIYSHCRMLTISTMIRIKSKLYTLY